MRKTVEVLTLQSIGTDEYAFGLVVDDNGTVEPPPVDPPDPPDPPDPEGKVLFKLEKPVDITREQRWEYAAPSTGRAAFEGTIRLGGPIKPDQQHVILFLISGKARPWKEVKSPGYVTVKRGGGHQFKLRTKEGPELGPFAFAGESASGLIRFKLDVDARAARCWLRDFEGPAQMTVGGVSEPFDGRLVAQVGHQDAGDQPSDDKGDEPWPDGTILEQFEIREVKQ